MRKLGFGILVLFTASALLVAFDIGKSLHELFVTSIITVESMGNPKAITKDGSAGILQIKPVMVKEVNRICKIKKIDKHFKLKDRFDVDKSIQMFWIYQNFYNKDSSYEKMARDWNGGPNGHKKKATKKYWNKVNKVFIALKQADKKTENTEM
jgi:hypothetical protein